MIEVCFSFCLFLGVFRALKTIYHKEGPLGYYKGTEDLKILHVCRLF